MSDDLYVWKGPRELDASAAADLVARWLDEGGDPAASPFEPSTDVGWFYRELRHDAPAVEAVTDAVPTGTGSILLSSTDEPPARVVAIPIGPHLSADDADAIVGLAAKYDLVLFDPRGPVLRQPLADLADVASATFWPAGAIRAAVAGLIGLGIAVAGWVTGVPILNVVLVIVGGFLAVMSVLTFVHEGRKRLRAGRAPGPPPG